MSRELSSYERDGVRTVLRMEEYDIRDDVSLSKHYNIVTRAYEIGQTSEYVDDARLLSSYALDAPHPNGRVFRIMCPEPITMRYTCRMTDRGEDGQVIVPREPFDEGTFEIEPGDYHFWDESEYL